MRAHALLLPKDSAFSHIELLCNGGARNHSGDSSQKLGETGLVLLITQFHRMIS
jgi:hypothetical protein